MSSPDTRTLRRLHRRLNELRRQHPHAGVILMPGARPRTWKNPKNAATQAIHEIRSLTTTYRETAA
jgi:hypothetical protein